VLGGLDQASIHGTHQGLRPCAAPPGRTHDRNWPSMQIREKLLASRGPSTHDPEMRFVPVKTVEQQAALTMLGVRDLLVKQRSMLLDAIRGHAAEFGVTVAESLPSRKRGDPDRWPSCCSAWRAMRACRCWRARWSTRCIRAAMPLREGGRPHMDSRFRACEENAADPQVVAPRKRRESGSPEPASGQNKG
jgi:hypothetical protein